MSLRTVLIGVLLLLVAAYVGWPYYTLYRINAALEADDRATLDAMVDWQAVREGLKSEVEALHTPTAAAGADGQEGESSVLGGGLAALIAPRMNEMLVDAYATPQGLARLIREGRVEAGAARAPDAAPEASPAQGAARASGSAADETEFTPAVSHAIEFARGKLVEALALAIQTYQSLRAEYDYLFFTDAVTFRVQYAPRSPAQTAPLVLVLRLQERGWRLTRVILPRVGDGK
jgi:hypothetical protein